MTDYTNADDESGETSDGFEPGQTVWCDGKKRTVEQTGPGGVKFEDGTAASTIECWPVEDDDTEPRDVDFGATESAVTQRDTDDTQLVADGGSTLTEPLTDSLVSDRLNQHDDPGHEDGNSIDDVYGAFADLQSELGDYLDDYDEYHEVVHEDSALVVYDLGPDNADLSIALDEIGVDDEPLRLVISSVMHDLAEQHTDSGRWGDTYPLVVVKDECTREAERRTRRRLGALTYQQGGAARALDYWATKVQGLTFEQWSTESGRSTGAIGNSIRRGREVHAER